MAVRSATRSASQSWPSSIAAMCARTATWLAVYARSAGTRAMAPPAPVPPTTAAALSPARFHPFAGEMTLRARSPPGTVTKGVNSAPGSTRGACTSSLTMPTPWRAATRATSASSSWVGTVPVGLCGFERSSAPRPEVATASSSAATSYRPSAVSGTVTRRRPVAATTEWKGG